MQSRTLQQGVTIIEILVAVAIITIALGAILGLAVFALVNGDIARQTTQAVAFAQDTMEATRNFRDGTTWSTGLAALTSGDNYHAEQSGGQWQMISGPETMNEFTRRVVLSDVCRDAIDDITTCPGSYADTDTKKVVVEVSWTERGRQHTVELTNYMTNWNQ